MPDEDAIDRIIGEWAAVHPELDTTPMAVIGRAHRLSLAVADQVDRHFRASGVSRGDYDVLASLRRAGDPPRQTPGQLGLRLLLSSAGITGRLNRLEGQGLIRRLPDPDDGRGVLVELTAVGVQLVDRLVREDMSRQAAWTGALSAAERDTLVRLLRKLLIEVEGPADPARRAPLRARGDLLGVRREANRGGPRLPARPGCRGRAGHARHSQPTRRARWP